MKLIIAAVLFFGGSFENIPPTYNTIKNVKIPSNPITKEITGIIEDFKEK